MLLSPIWLACSECVARHKRTAKGWQGLQVLEVLRGWHTYLGYGVPCVLMVCLEVRCCRYCFLPLVICSTVYTALAVPAS